MTARIAVPDIPGLNGVEDMMDAVSDYGMKPVRLRVHFHNESQLEENCHILAQEVDGAALAGGFPFEDRLGFGVVPAHIEPYRNALRTLVDSGKPVLGVCAHSQIGHAMDLAFDEPGYHVTMEPNVYDRRGRIVRRGFLDAQTPVHVDVEPERTAFTRNWKRGQVMRGVIDHGGGRFVADDDTLIHLIANDMIVTRYSTPDGAIVDDYPYNPNGSMMSIESITNRRGNLKLGMLHNERLLNVLEEDASNLVFPSMREYIEDGCPDLSENIRPRADSITQKDLSYLQRRLDPERTATIYIKMLTDDNQRNTASLFLDGMSVERRRLIRMEFQERPDLNAAADAARAIADHDLIDGIMLKKDLPTVRGPDGSFARYEVVSKEPFRREWILEEDIVGQGRPMLTSVPKLDLQAHDLEQRLRLPEDVTALQTGTTWFFESEADKQRAIHELFG